MQLGALLQNVEVISCNADLTVQIDAVCFDSRVVTQTSAYVASMRPNADGHDYIDAAIANHAAVIVAERPVDGYAHVVVKNGCLALAQMAANLYGNPAEHMTMIGITGTKGKTTTAYMLKHVLERTLGTKVGLVGTVCNMAGDEILEKAKNTTPEAPELQRILREMADKGCTHVVMEVSSHALAFERLTNIRFRVGVFNNLSQDHLDYHKTMENYLQAKSKLFDICDFGAVNADDPASAYILEHTKSEKLTFGIHTSAIDFRACDVELLASDGIRFTVDGVAVNVPIPGMFTVYNAMSALSAAKLLGIDMASAAASLADMYGVPGRIETVRSDAPFKVIVDYAHSPDSVEKVLEAVHEFTQGSVISVFGCGGNRDRTKRPKMAKAASKLSGYVIITTDNPRFETPEEIIAEIVPGIADTDCPYEVVVDRTEAIHRAIDLAKPGDTVLLMGKGHENYQEICGVRHHFDDREIAAAYLADKGAK